MKISLLAMIVAITRFVNQIQVALVVAHSLSMMTMNLNRQKEAPVAHLLVDPEVHLPEAPVEAPVAHPVVLQEVQVAPHEVPHEVPVVAALQAEVPVAHLLVDLVAVALQAEVPAAHLLVDLVAVALQAEVQVVAPLVKAQVADHLSAKVPLGD